MQKGIKQAIDKSTTTIAIAILAILLATNGATITLGQTTDKTPPNLLNM